MASISLAAAMGEGPVVNTYEGEIVSGAPLNNQWWGVSGLASANLNDSIHAEVAAGYKSRDFDNYKFANGDSVRNGSWDQWSILGGIYYDPVDQLTIGVEGEWTTTDRSATLYDVENDPDLKGKYESNYQNYTIDLVSVWRF